MNPVRPFSIRSLVRNAFSSGDRLQPMWRTPEPARAYDVIIIGGGAHGLAAAYYLARAGGGLKIAVVERGWIGGGNSGRNTAIIRSNYFHDASIAMYERGLKLYEGLSDELSFNIMFTQCGTLTVAHDPVEMDYFRRWSNAIEINGVESDLLSREEVLREVPELDASATARYPILGGIIQRQAGIARHDAVVWGYARAADALGVDILQGCEVTGFDIQGERVIGIETTSGTIAAGQVGVSVAGHGNDLLNRAGVRLPLCGMILQAMVTEPVKPFLHCILESALAHVYVSQSDRGELVIGAGIDGYPSYGQRGNLPLSESTIEALVNLVPCIGELRLMRQWAGIVDISPDFSPILGSSGIDGLWLNAGWGTGGFKASPVAGEMLAHHLAEGQLHPLAEPFTLERFANNRLVDESTAGSVAH